MTRKFIITIEVDVDDMHICDDVTNLSTELVDQIGLLDVELGTISNVRLVKSEELIGLREFDELPDAEGFTSTTRPYLGIDRSQYPK